MVTIIPAILAKTEQEYSETLKKIEEAHVFEDGWIHIDLMDNKFVQNESIGPEIISKYPTSLKKEIHLMVENPTDWIDKLGNVDRILIHAEVDENATNLAINPETPISTIENKKPETVLIMGVHPGKQGQEFITETVEKVKAIKAQNPDILVGVDGGITAENAKLVVDAGADYLVIGSHLIEGEINENLEIIWEALEA